MSGRRIRVLRTTGSVGLSFTGEIGSITACVSAGVDGAFAGASAITSALGAAQDASPMAKRNVADIFTRGEMLAGFDGRNRAEGFRSGIKRERAIEAVVAELFEHVGGPSRGAGNREDRSEKVGRNSEGVINRGRVEIDVCFEAFAFTHDFCDAF